MSLVDRFLKKIGIGDYTDLTAEERKVFDQWNKELEGKPVTVNDLVDFLKSQQTVNIAEFEDFANMPKKDLFLKVYSRICRQIISFIENPEKVKKMREDNLKEKIDGMV